MNNDHQVITISPIFTNNNTVIIRNNESNKCLRCIKKFHNLPLLIKVIIIGVIIVSVGISIFVTYLLVSFGKYM